MNVMYAVLIFIRANEESETKADRVQKAHRRKRDQRSSFAFGQGPGWLRPNETKTGWEPVAELVGSVQKVFEYSAKGYGSTAIAKIANREKWPVPARAKDWHKTLPNKLVRNRRVLGEFEPQTKQGRERVPTGELWEGYYPEIVSLQLFDQASAAVERRRLLPKRRDNGYHNVFQGLLKCGHCGATLARKAKGGGKNSAGYAQYVCANSDRGVSPCKNWNARELEETLIPPLMQYVASDALEGSLRQQTRAALEAERVTLAQHQKAAANLLATMERMGGSRMIETRFRTLEEHIQQSAARVAALSVRTADPMLSVWEEDVDQAILDALRAVRDITSEMTDEREELHQSLLRVVKELRVWPRSHALAHLHGSNEALLLPLSLGLPALSEAHGPFLPDWETGFRLAA